MPKAVSDWLRSRSHRKGSIEVSHLAIWILLIVFLLVMLALIMWTRGSTTATVDSLCTKSGGLFGC